MEEELGKFLNVTLDPSSYLSEYKQRTDKKIIGCTPMYIPGEIIHAAGMLPVILWESNEPITVAYAHIQPLFCGFIRSIVDIALKGKLDFLDSWVFCDDCLAVRTLDFIVRNEIPTVAYQRLYLPVIIKSPSAKVYTVEEFERFRSSVGEFAGREVSDESLMQSILIYNKNRALLRRLYQLRRTKPGLISAKEVSAIVMSSGLMPKEEHNELLEKLLPQLEGKTAPSDNRVKLVLSGGLCQAPRADTLDLIEGGGGVIVDDDLYIGSRYFATDAEVDTNPIESLANRYLNMKLRCPVRSDPEKEWGDQLVDRVKGSQAQGVITLKVRNCEPHMFYAPDVSLKLAEAGIPELILDVEHEEMALGQTRVRVEAFIEVLRGGAGG